MFFYLLVKAYPAFRLLFYAYGFWATLAIVAGTFVFLFIGRRLTNGSSERAKRVLVVVLLGVIGSTVAYLCILIVNAPR